MRRVSRANLLDLMKHLYQEEVGDQLDDVLPYIIGRNDYFCRKFISIIVKYTYDVMLFFKWHTDNEKNVEKGLYE